MAGDEAAGTAGGIVDRSGEFAELIAMWVAPAWRGRGVAAALIEQVAMWAARTGFAELRLWVVEGNFQAERAYGRAGFSRTGNHQPVRPGEPAIEFEMAMALRPA